MSKREPLYPHVPKSNPVPRGVYRDVSPEEIARERLVERAIGYRAFSYQDVSPIIGDLEEALGSSWRAVEKLEHLEKVAPDPVVRLTVRKLLDRIKEICPKIDDLYEESKFLVRIG